MLESPAFTRTGWLAYLKYVVFLRQTTWTATLNFVDPVAAYSSAGESKHFHSFTVSHFQSFTLVLCPFFCLFFLNHFWQFQRLPTGHEQHVRWFMKRIEVSLKTWKKPTLISH